MMVLPHFHTYIYSDSRLVPIGPHEKSKRIIFPELPGYNTALFVPFPEIILFPENHKVGNTGSYIIMNDIDAAFLRTSKREPKPMEDLFKEHNRRRKKGPGTEEREMQSFFLVINIIDKEGIQNSVVVKGSDMYGITASLMGYAVEEIISSTSLRSGIITPCGAFGSSNILEKIVDDHNLIITKEVGFREYLEK